MCALCTSRHTKRIYSNHRQRKHTHVHTANMFGVVYNRRSMQQMPCRKRIRKYSPMCGKWVNLRVYSLTDWLESAYQLQRLTKFITNAIYLSRHIDRYSHNSDYFISSSVISRQFTTKMTQEGGKDSRTETSENRKNTNRNAIDFEMDHKNMYKK